MGTGTRRTMENQDGAGEAPRHPTGGTRSVNATVPLQASSMPAAIASLSVRPPSRSFLCPSRRSFVRECARHVVRSAARAAASVGIPAVVSFTVETDGTLPTGASPLSYGINCAHPDHFGDTLAVAVEAGEPGSTASGSCGRTPPA